MRLKLHPGCQREQGSAVIMILAMLAIMLICVAVNTAAIGTLKRELKLLETRQVRRLLTAPNKHSDTPVEKPAQNEK